jgi:hypothetical protein
MANFQKGVGVGGTGFNDSAYSLTLPLDNRRSVGLFGGGPKGEDSNVVAADPSKLRISEHKQTRDYTALDSNVREFWVDGIDVGTTALLAKLPDGTEYCQRLPVTITNSADKAKMLDSFRSSRDTLTTAYRNLGEMSSALLKSQLNPPSTWILSHPPVLNNDQKRWMKAVSKWLNLADFDARLPPTEYKAWVTKVVWNVSSARGLMQKNLQLQNDVFVRVPDGFNACVYGPGSDGIECGEPFFSKKGPKCRRDVLTHEVFHLFGVGHGIDPLNGPTVHRFGITPDQSLNSADNLAELVADIIDDATDSCWVDGV